MILDPFCAKSSSIMLNTSLKANFSKQPSSYPPVAFHVIRISQFLSAAVVLGILSFFVNSLEVERYRVPWTFILVGTFPASICPDGSNPTPSY
jgi:hypothetical protein